MSHIKSIKQNYQRHYISTLFSLRLWQLIWFLRVVSSFLGTFTFLFNWVEELVIWLLLKIIEVDIFYAFIFSPPEEQVVGCCRDYLVLPQARADLRHIAIIVIVPLTWYRVLRKGRVVAESRAAEVVGNSKAIVDERTWSKLLIWHYVRRHIKAFKWEFDESI